MYGPIERQLAKQDDTLEQAWLYDAVCGEHAKRDREVVRGAGFANVGWCQVYCDSVTRELEP